ncbi:MAG: YigZ family protein [Methanomicrobiaceae archaeon]|nr:YigZ family protein [Methanomicrobiaceae archaeon]
MQELSAIKYEEKKSRFFAHLYFIESPQDFSDILESHKKMYKKAAHHCSALNIVSSKGEVIQEFKNDREVGNPGRILCSLLENNGLNSHVIVVSRLFGGIKLGPSGVTRAFRDAGDAAVSHYLEKKTMQD